MMYKTNQDLPSGVRDRLSDSAQDLYRAAFNSAIQWYGEESKAHKVAWCAVRIQLVSLNSVINTTIDAIAKPVIA
jgi:cation transport regulator